MRGDKTRQFTLHKQVQGKVKIELKTERENAKEKSAEINFFLSLSLHFTPPREREREKRFVPCLYCQLHFAATMCPRAQTEEKFSIIARSESENYVNFIFALN